MVCSITILREASSFWLASMVFMMRLKTAEEEGVEALVAALLLLLLAASTERLDKSL